MKNRLFLAASLLALLVPSQLTAQTPGELDGSFATGSLVDDTVRVVVPAADGKMYVAGDFTTVRGALRSRIARLNADGTVDPTFNPGTGVSMGTVITAVYAVAVQTDGRVLIGGSFGSYNGTARNCIARLNSDGSLDSSFNPGTGASGTVSAVVVQADGKMLIGGGFTSYNGAARNRIARLNSDGSLDTSFNPGMGANNYVHAVAVQADGKVLIGGNFTSYNGAARNRIARLNSDGSLDTGFNPGTGANDVVYTIALQTAGKVLIGGSFSTYNGTGRNCIARLNPDGSLDTSFNPGTGASATVSAVVVQADGKMLIGGSFGSYNDTACGRIARLNSDGSLDTSFNSSTGAISEVNDVAVQTDGKVLIGGLFTSYNGTGRSHIARLNTDGSLDTGFDPGTGAIGGVRAVAVQADGKVLIGGSFSSYNGTARSRIARLNSDGSLNTSFNPGTGASNTVLTVAVQTDGRVLIGGIFRNYNGTGRDRIARLNSDGSLDTSFNPGTGANGTVRAVAVQADGKVLIGGSFSSYNGTARSRIARLNSDGSLDTSFNPGTGAFGTVNALAVQADGKVLIGGNFTSYNGTARNRIARLNSDGSLDTSFDPGTGANNEVIALAVQADGKILIGGYFLNYNGTGRNYIARLNADGSLDTSFNPGTGANEVVYTIALQTAGKVLIGGNFTSYNGTARNRIARLNSDGSLDTSFNPGTGVNNWAYTIALQTAGKVLIGGEFTSYNDVAVSYLVRVEGGAPSAPEIAISGNSVDIVDGDSTPEAGDHTDFGSVNVTGGSIGRTFTITNSGTAALNLTGTPPNYVTLSGSGAFTVTQQPASAIVAANGGTQTFQITFDPATSGTHSATVSIANDDADENPFTFALTGTGLTPEQVFTNTLTAAGLIGDDTEPDATPFDDGVENLLKYAFNMNLTGPDSRTMGAGGGAGLPAIDMEGSGSSGTFRFEFVRRKNSGLIYTPMTSPDLSPESWEPLTATPTVTSIDGTWERVVYGEPVNLTTTPTSFGQVEVSMPSP